jgi:hypothetical protein
MAEGGVRGRSKPRASCLWPDRVAFRRASSPLGRVRHRGAARSVRIHRETLEGSSARIRDPAAGWFPFEPGPDGFSPDSVTDLGPRRPLKQPTLRVAMVCR